MCEGCRFLNHLLVGCFWSCASFRCCNNPIRFFSNEICVDPPKEQPIAVEAVHCVQKNTYKCIGVLCHCVHMHQHQQWFTVKEFGISDDNDGNRIICGREVKFMLGNAFLQSHCLWTVANVYKCTHAHRMYIPFFVFASCPMRMHQGRHFVCRSHYLRVFMNFIWKY